MLSWDQLCSYQSFLQSILQRKNYKFANVFLDKLDASLLTQDFMLKCLQMTQGHHKNLPSRKKLIQSFKDELTKRDEALIREIKIYF